MRKFLLIILVIAVAVNAFARPDSLRGIDSAKFVVDLNQGDAKKLKLRLSLILETMDHIEEHGVKTDVVVAVRGGASKFMLITDAMVDYNDSKIKGEIFNIISTLSKRGVKLEQCGVALKILKIDPKEVHPRFEVVKNGYVSLIGYQNRGHAILPME